MGKMMASEGRLEEGDLGPTRDIHSRDGADRLLRNRNLPGEDLLEPASWQKL